MVFEDIGENANVVTFAIKTKTIFKILDDILVDLNNF